MRKFVFAIVVFFCVLLAGCGGGGGGGAVSEPRTNFTVTISDSGCGFSSAGQTNFVLLAMANGTTYEKEYVRAIYPADINYPRNAAFDISLGKPSHLDKDGFGMFEIRITQGAANIWTSGDPYDRWKVNGNIYVLCYSTTSKNYPGWTVWCLSPAGYIGKLEGRQITVYTYFISRSRSESKPVQSMEDDQISAAMEKLRKIYRL